MFPFSLFLKREGEVKHRETPPSLHYFFFIFFPIRAYCQVLFVNKAMGVP